MSSDQQAFIISFLRLRAFIIQFHKQPNNIWLGNRKEVSTRPSLKPGQGEPHERHDLKEISSSFASTRLIGLLRNSIQFKTLMVDIIFSSKEHEKVGFILKYMVFIHNCITINPTQVITQYISITRVCNRPRSYVNILTWL